jgi:16S rRNA G966 N2-methylase RsmD
VLAEYISTKCNSANVILDAFAGMGSVSIKLASHHSCKIIANESDKQKLSFLFNNAKIYEVDSCIELSTQDFLKIERSNIDIVFVQPPIVNLEMQIWHLDSIIQKAMKLAPNILMLLPADTSINLLCVLIHKWASRLSWMKDFCSIRI